MRTLIRNATCVFPDETRQASVLLAEGRIADIAPPASTAADVVIDADELLLIPGVIDDQVHFRDPGLTHKEDLHTGSVACAAGGVTTFLEMPNTNPTTTSVAALDAKLDLAATKCVVNYGFYIGATPDNVDELRGATRTPGIKIFIGSSTGNLLVDEQEALERIFAETTLPITAHCEDEATIRANVERVGTTSDVRDHSRIRDHEAARIATERAIGLAYRHQHRFHVLHVSTAGELPLIADHRNLITAEACLHHLFLDTTDYERLGTRAQMNPSLKNPEDREALWEALRGGGLQVVATDHAPHTLEEKAQPYPASPSGVPAVENSLALMLDAAHHGHCTIEEIVHWMCDAPARVWDIENKGRLVEGYDADVVLVDPKAVRTIRDAEQHTKSRWSPWDGTTLTGWPVATFVGGRCVMRDGAVDTAARGSEVRFDHDRGGYWGES